MSATKIKSLHECLVRNALDFLETAIEQFEKAPKYSVIDFCAAVELVLKARLMHEHWSLIVAGKEPNLKHFRSGDFKSINFADIAPRIEAVTGEMLPKDAVECFGQLAKHRNKMVHFFHEADQGDAREKLLNAIAVEQTSGWFHLRRLLEHWDFIFDDQKERIDKISDRMKRHDVYLETVFSKLKDEIAALKIAGATFRKCPACGRDAARVEQCSDMLSEFTCMVCSRCDYVVRVPCSSDGCTGTFEITEDSDDALTCPNCECEFKKSELLSALDTDPVTHDNYMDYVPINCAYCSEMASVVQHHDYLVCTNCLFVDTEAPRCGWCNERQIGGGDLEMSFHTGCEFCDGHADWDRDD